MMRRALAGSVPGRMSPGLHRAGTQTLKLPSFQRTAALLVALLLVAAFAVLRLRLDTVAAPTTPPAPVQATPQTAAAAPYLPSLPLPQPPQSPTTGPPPAITATVVLSCSPEQVAFLRNWFCMFHDTHRLAGVLRPAAANTPTDPVATHPPTVSSDLPSWAPVSSVPDTADVFLEQFIGASGFLSLTYGLIGPPGPEHADTRRTPHSDPADRAVAVAVWILKTQAGYHTPCVSMLHGMLRGMLASGDALTAPSAPYAPVLSIPNQDVSFGHVVRHWLGETRRARTTNGHAHGVLILSEAVVPWSGDALGALLEDDGYAIGDVLALSSPHGMRSPLLVLKDSKELQDTLDNILNKLRVRKSKRDEFESFMSYFWQSVVVNPTPLRQSAPGSYRVRFPIAFSQALNEGEDISGALGTNSTDGIKERPSRDSRYASVDNSGMVWWSLNVSVLDPTRFMPYYERFRKCSGIYAGSDIRPVATEILSRQSRLAIGMGAQDWLHVHPVMVTAGLWRLPFAMYPMQGRDAMSDVQCAPPYEPALGDDWKARSLIHQHVEAFDATFAPGIGPPSAGPKTHADESNVEFDSLLARKAINGDILMIVANSGFFDFLASFVCRLKELGITNYVLVALDEELDARLREHRIVDEWHRHHLGPAVDTLIDGTMTFNSQSYNRIVTTKVGYVQYALQRGYSVVLSDIDIFLYRNPFPLFSRNADIEMISDDLPSESTLYINMCTGFYYARPTARTLNLFKTWKERIVPDWNDQHIFNDAKYGIPLTVHVLNKAWYASGATHLGLECGDLYWHQNLESGDTGVDGSLGLKGLVRPVLLHYNWLDGSAYKRDQMKAHGHLLVDEAFRCVPYEGQWVLG